MASIDAGDDLVIFVPGFTGPDGGARLRGFVQYATTETYSKRRVAVKATQRSFQGYSGVRFTVPDGAGSRTVDVVEVDWEAGVKKLSTQPLPQRLLSGFALLGRAVRAAIAVGREGLGFGVLSAVGVLLIAAWAYLALAAAVTAFGKLFPDGLKWLHIPPDLFGPQGIPYVVVFLVVGGLTFVGLDADSAADIADLYDRYLTNGPMYGSYRRMGDELVQQVRDALDANAAPYRRVRVVGHSFGALPAVEAAALCGRPVELVTIGTFFAFLQRLNPGRIAAMLTAVRKAAPAIERWTDFYSDRDYIAATTAFEANVGEYTGKSVPLATASRKDTLTLHAHLLYFEEEQVLDAIFRPAAA